MTEKIRNFSIIAHIDHGKSTLADRLLESTKTKSAREMKDRLLDTLELEQERGITIKLQSVRMKWAYSGNKETFKGKEFILNLIDTPGHVDFTYEVSRSLAACEGAILLIDATQGIQAQTLSTLFQAWENNLQILPVLNKIDLPNAEIERRKQELTEYLGFKESEILMTSAKTGEGVIELLNKIVEVIPAPTEPKEKDLKALIFDSFYDEHKGIVTLVKVVSGGISSKRSASSAGLDPSVEPDLSVGPGSSAISSSSVVSSTSTGSGPSKRSSSQKKLGSFTSQDLASGKKLYMIQKKTSFFPIEIGYLNPGLSPQKQILAGEVGYIATGFKDLKKVGVGDTISDTEDTKPLAGYKKIKPMVFASLYPIDSDEFEKFRQALERLALNDSAIEYKMENSKALGFGFRCGFLGLLHMEIAQERLSREFGADIIITTPTVEYKIITHKETFRIQSAQDFPSDTTQLEIQEPWVELEIITPEEYIGSIMQFCKESRGIYKDTKYLSSKDNVSKRVILTYEIPLAEIIINFFSKLKSISHGYASMDYRHIDFRTADVMRVDILVNKETVEPLSFLTNSANARATASKVISILKEKIPKHQFKIPLQAAIGGKIIAREDISALRKDVTAKLYGGDVTRKKKLLEKQKKGKKKLKEIGGVSIPQEAFLSVLKR